MVDIEIVDEKKSSSNQYNSQKNNIELDDHLLKMLTPHCLGLLKRLENYKRTTANYAFTQIEIKALLYSLLETINLFDRTYDETMIRKTQKDVFDVLAYFSASSLSVEQKKYVCKVFFEYIGSYFMKNYPDEKYFYDLLTNDGMLNNAMIRSYIFSEKSAYRMQLTIERNMILFMVSMVELFAGVDDSTQDKIDYIFHSSSEIVSYFFYSNKEVIESFFSKKMLDNFNKETLSYLYRIYGFDGMNDDLSQADDRYLKVISAMSDYILHTTGNNFFFFYYLFSNLYSKSEGYQEFEKLVINYYDSYFEKDKEKNFDDAPNFHLLLNFLLCQKCDMTDNIFKERKLDNQKKYEDIYKTKEFSTSNILDRMNNLVTLHETKKLYYQLAYGISFEQAMYICSTYGEYLEEYQDEISQEDQWILDMLQDIVATSYISLEEVDKVQEIQWKIHRIIEENGFIGKIKDANYPVLRSFLNRMFMKRYNAKLFKVDDNTKVLSKDNGVLVVDAGLKFSMLVSCVNAAQNFYDEQENSKDRYNTSHYSHNQGICCSYINNQNLGIISLDRPILGFSNLSDDCLISMGIGDIYSEPSEVDPRKSCEADCCSGTYFTTPDSLIDNTRFGYNELFIDRFLPRDEKGEIKVQPSYIVVYKFDEKYQNSKHYKNGLKMAQEFHIPMVVVDILKVKENEKKIIEAMEEELFSQTTVNKDLVMKIMTRYMNNYSGSLTMTRSSSEIGNHWNYYEDFSVLGIDRFLLKVQKHFRNLEPNEIVLWKEALEEAYEVEKEKNERALAIDGYNYSLTNEEFLLDDVILFKEKLEAIVNDRADGLLNGDMNNDDVSFHFSDLSPGVKVLINLANLLYPEAYHMIPTNVGVTVKPTASVINMNECLKEVYGAVMSYFLNDYSNNYFTNLECGDRITDNFVNNMLYLNKDDDDVFVRESFSNDIAIGLLNNLEHLISRTDYYDFMEVFRPILDELQTEQQILALEDEISNRRENFHSLVEKNIAIILGADLCHTKHVKQKIKK